MSAAGPQLTVPADLWAQAGHQAQRAGVTAPELLWAATRVGLEVLTLRALRVQGAAAAASAKPADDLSGLTIGPFRVGLRAEPEGARRGATPLWRVRCCACYADGVRRGNRLREARSGKRGSLTCSACSYTGQNGTGGRQATRRARSQQRGEDVPA